MSWPWLRPSEQFLQASQPHHRRDRGSGLEGCQYSSSDGIDDKEGEDELVEILKQPEAAPR